MSEKFYLGKLFDPSQNKLTDQPLQYDPADLTTHAIVTGMTGSGKTGLCIGLMEEAALQGIPAILIDPKGDLTNLLLHFPELNPQDFQPWLDPELARRADKSVEQAATDAALAWRNGLAEWGIGPARLAALKASVEFAVYTPGSDAGIPVSVLSSLAAPGLDWAANREVLTERIASTVTAILGLVGFNNIDPLRSREHILLSNIFQSAWSQNRSLDLTELILQIQTPPFDKLGAFPVEAFFPSKDRMDLALQVNNILAAPTFELWRVGQPLDVKSLLFAADGRPRHSVFYLAHLSDAERMFFVTLLFSAVETWMRTQAGTSSLRALLYMDEIFGYLPPTAIPPSKPPLLRMLKQARAFGLGLVLATQNPVDVDYKALSNAGTWFIGKLQTDQDKQRLLDGLESATPGTLDRAAIDRLISSLGKRVFLMQNVHEKQPVVFQTRWTMNFLAGPLTRMQIPELNKLVGANVPVKQAAESQGVVSPAVSNEPVKPAGPAVTGSATRPPIPAGYPEFFLPLNLSFAKALAAAGRVGEATMSGILYRPVLLASAQVRFLDRRYSLDAQQIRSVLVTALDKRGIVRWEDFERDLLDEKDMDPVPEAQGRFAESEGPLTDAKMLASLQKDFADWVYRSSKVTVRANQTLGVFATPEISQAEFVKACTEAARTGRDAAVAKATATFDQQIKTLRDRLAREERELSQDQVELENRKWEERGNIAEIGASLIGLTRKKSVTTQLTKHRLTEQAKADVEESVDTIAQYKRQLADLEQARQQALAEAGSNWGDVVNQVTEIPVSPKKTDVYVSLFGVAWLPYYQASFGGQAAEIPAFA